MNTRRNTFDNVFRKYVNVINNIFTKIKAIPEKSFIIYSCFRHLSILMYTVGKKYIIIKTLSLILLFNNSGIRTHDLQVNALINRATP